MALTSIRWSATSNGVASVSAIRSRDGLHGDVGGVGFEPGEHQQELVGAAVQEQVAGGSAIPQPVGDLGQHDVTASMPDGVVDAPEAVEVDVEQRDEITFALRARKRHLQMLGQHLTRRQAGQEAATDQQRRVGIGVDSRPACRPRSG